MDQAILREFRNSGQVVHVVFFANAGEARWRNGKFMRIEEESSLFETLYGDTIALRNEDIIRVEPYEKPRPREGMIDD